jgi:DNA-binding NarL/FixJ family response regulator
MCPTLQSPKSRTDKKPSVFVVDDHPIVCRGMIELLSNDCGLQPCGQADSAEKALREIVELKPDLVLLDLSLKGMSGIELIKTLRVRLPELPVLVVSMHDETIFAERALRAGAKGYIMKGEPPERLIEAVHRVLEGRVYLSSAISERIIVNVFDGPKPNSQVSPVATLSDREMEIFQLIGQARKTRQIAEQLHLSVKTVEAHRAHIKEKLGLKDHMELVKYAIHYVSSENN